MKKLLALLFGLSISTNSIAQPDGDFVTISIEDGLVKQKKESEKLLCGFLTVLDWIVTGKQ